MASLMRFMFSKPLVLLWMLVSSRFTDFPSPGSSSHRSHLGVTGTTSLLAVEILEHHVGLGFEVFPILPAAGLLVLEFRFLLVELAGQPFEADAPCDDNTSHQSPTDGPDFSCRLRHLVEYHRRFTPSYPVADPIFHYCDGAENLIP